MSPRAGLAIITSSVVLFALVATHAPLSVSAAPLSTNKCLDRGDSPVQCAMSATEVQVGWVWPTPESNAGAALATATTTTTKTTTHAFVDADEAMELEALERRSLWSHIKHAVSHVAHVVTHPIRTVAHAVTHPMQTIKHVAHAVTHPISTIKHAVHHVTHTIKHAVHTVAHTVRSAVHTIKHTVKTVAHSVKSAYKFIKTNGPTIAKIGLKALASAQGIVGTVAKVVPGLGIPMSKALETGAKAADMASGMIHAKIPGPWGKVMSAMDFAEDPLGNTLKKAGLHGAVGAAASMAASFL